MSDRYTINKAQRDWRRRVIVRLKHKLGLWCRGCESPDSLGLASEGESYLNLVIPKRRSPELARFGNNTVTIYTQILKGKLPIDTVTLLCDDCNFRMKQENYDSVA